MNFSRSFIPLLCAALAAAFAVCVHGAPQDTREAFSHACPGFTPVIDAGHGGADGGAASADGMKESEINLDIALRLENVFAFCGVPPVMTRREENIEYPAEAATLKAKKLFDQKARLELINKTQNAVLISVHQNKYSDPKPCGAQVFYNSGEGARELAAAVQQNIKLFDASNTRAEAAISNEIYIMREARASAILIECAFLSNGRDCALLKTENYRVAMALAAAAAFMELY